MTHKRAAKGIGGNVGVRHLDLFSGIGGFAYAADIVFGDVAHTFVEWDTFCQAVLHKHWPEAPIYGDIREFTSYPNEDAEHTFILTGGFPCQPFSAAGLRRGTADERYLWPEMLRVIQLTMPTWVIAENVRGLVTWSGGMVLEQVCADLENTGYEVQPLIIPAVAVNAPHRRDRIWFIANRTSDRRQRGGPSLAAEEGYEARPEQAGKLARRPERSCSDASDAERERLEGRQHEGARQRGQPGRVWQYQRPDWGQDWTKVAAEFCSVDDGLPVELDELKLTQSQHRKKQLKAYGNAIVPQVAMQVMQAIQQAEYEKQGSS